MSCTHSVMRVATTASPVSGTEVRAKMIELSEHVVAGFYFFPFQNDGAVSGAMVGSLVVVWSPHGLCVYVGVERLCVCVCVVVVFVAGTPRESSSAACLANATAVGRGWGRAAVGQGERYGQA